MPQCDVCDPVIRESLNFTLDTLELQLSCLTASGPRRGRGGSAACDAVELEACPRPRRRLMSRGLPCNRLVDVTASLMSG